MAEPARLEALGVLARAEQVIRRREAQYRYPAAQVYGGGLTEATEVENGTTYPYRVQTKAHLLGYWNGRQSQVTAILGGGGIDEGLQLREAIDVVGEPLAVEWPASDGVDGSVDVGGQEIGPSVTTLDLGSEPGWWAVGGELVAGGLPIDVTGGVVRSDVLAATPAKGMTLLYPADPAAQGVLAGVLPSLRWAWLHGGQAPDEPAALVLGPDDDGDGSVSHADLVYAPVVEGDPAAFRTAAVGFPLPVGRTAGGELLTIAVANAELSGSVGATGIVSPVVLEGQLSVADIVTAGIELAGFDEAGTLALLGGVWGFDPADPPEWVPIEAELTIE